MFIQHNSQFPSYRIYTMEVFVLLWVCVCVYTVLGIELRVSQSSKVFYHWVTSPAPIMKFCSVKKNNEITSFAWGGGVAEINGSRVFHVKKKKPVSERQVPNVFAHCGSQRGEKRTRKKGCHESRMEVIRVEKKGLWRVEKQRIKRSLGVKLIKLCYMYVSIYHKQTLY